MINVSLGAFLNLQGGVIVTDGNSITFEAREADGTKSSLTYPVQLGQHPLIEPLGVTIRNTGIGGQNTDAMINRAPTFVDPYYVPGKSVLVAWEFTNQAGNKTQSAAVIYGKFVNYCRARKAVGWKIVVVTALARNRQFTDMTHAEYNGKLNDANQLLKDNWRQYADQIVDVRQIPQLDPVQTAYIPDGTHPNALGHSFFVKTLAPTIRRMPRN